MLDSLIDFERIYDVIPVYVSKKTGYTVKLPNVLQNIDEHNSNVHRIIENVAVWQNESHKMTDFDIGQEEYPFAEYEFVTGMFNSIDEVKQWLKPILWNFKIQFK